MPGDLIGPAPTTVDALEKRHTLHQVRGWFEIHADYLDSDMGPEGMWIDGPVIGKFRTREDAATFMRGYTKENA